MLVSRKERHSAFAFNLEVSNIESNGLHKKNNTIRQLTAPLRL